MRQTDLLTDMYRRYHQTRCPNRKPDYSREFRYQRKMMVFRVRATGPDRAKSAGWQLRREMSRRIGPCLRVQSLMMEIATGPKNPFLMWEQIEMASALGSKSPVQQRWGETREYVRPELARTLEVNIILFVIPVRAALKQHSTEA